MMKVDIRKRILGWTGVAVTVVFSGIWAYWGAIENFHEGWYSVSLWENLFMLLFQYLGFTIALVVLALVILRWKVVGLVLHLALAGFCVWFFAGPASILIVLPLAAVALLYYFGDPQPKAWVYRLILLVPLVIILAISIPQGIRVSERQNDENFGMRIVGGNGVTLAWAPRGPGWPDSGISWQQAHEICRHLSEDGTTVMQQEQNIWRLPTAEEAVRSMMLHGENAGGVWDKDEQRAVYERTPDKETPLWDVHSKVIYYWTADESQTDETKALIVVYHGGIYEKRKTDSQDYLSFRAVK